MDSSCIHSTLGGYIDDNSVNVHIMVIYGNWLGLCWPWMPECTPDLAHLLNQLFGLLLAACANPFTCTVTSIEEEGCRDWENHSYMLARWPNVDSKGLIKDFNLSATPNSVSTPTMKCHSMQLYVLEHVDHEYESVHFLPFLLIECTNLEHIEK